MACLGGGRYGSGLVSGSGLAAGLDARGICPAGGIAMKRLSLFGAAALAVSCSAQNLTDVLKQGEQVFAKSCATGYCHGIGGGPSSAPRLAGRGFDQAYINNEV